MRAVWSFWTEPHARFNHLQWVTPRHHALSWVLSVVTASKHFEQLALWTDDAGAELLVDRLRLPFTHVSLGLNRLEHNDPDWWMFGKLYTYRAQTEPFVHIDSDAYLWSPLPARLLAAPLLAQNPEDARSDSPWYNSGLCRATLERAESAWIPPEWRWYDTLHNQTAACCGIFGGNRIDFIRHYADTAIRLLEHPANRPALDALPDKRVFNPLFEQYVLSACAARHSVPIEYLFESFEHAIAPGAAAQAGFTHIQAGAKSSAGVAARLEQRVARDYPVFYERCLREFGDARVDAQAIAPAA